MKWLLLVAAAVVGFVVVVWVSGMLLPKNHRATRMARFHQSPVVLWQTITDYEDFRNGDRM
jgi:hypothetical protein